MHRLTLPSTLLLAAVAAAPAPAAAAGLVLRYGFDDCATTVADLSGNGNDGAIAQAGNAACVDGVRGKALSLPGVTSPTPYAWSYVTTGPSDSLAFVDDYSFTVWFSVRSYDAMNGYGGYPDPLGGMHSIFAKSGDREGLLARTVRAEDGLHVLVHSGCFAAPCSGSAFLTPGTVGLGEWHMLTVTSGGGFVRAYLDGVLQNEMPTAEFGVNPTMPQKPFQLGVDQFASWYPLDGTLDEVCVHRRALAPEEVRAAFSARTCDVVPVALDVRPGGTPNPIQLSARGVVPAAVLGSATFDAATVDPATLVLAGARVALLATGRPQASLQDVNADGILDLVAQFPIASMTGLVPGAGVATLTGALLDGTPIYGQDAVLVLP
jgi:hypothetical protein